MISKLIPLSILLLIASCASTVVTDSEPELVDVRQGEQVKQICFASSINKRGQKPLRLLMLRRGTTAIMLVMPIMNIWCY